MVFICKNPRNKSEAGAGAVEYMVIAATLFVVLYPSLSSLGEETAKSSCITQMAISNNGRALTEPGNNHGSLGSFVSSTAIGNSITTVTIQEARAITEGYGDKCGQRFGFTLVPATPIDLGNSGG